MSIVGFLRLLGWLCIRCVVRLSCFATHFFCGHVCFKGPAKSWTNLLGFVQVVWHVVQVLRHWGRFPWWGGRSTPRYHVHLGRLSKRRQGGPWAPPPCSVNSPGNLLMTMTGCCLGSSGCCLFFVERLFFSGVGDCVFVR